MVFITFYAVNKWEHCRGHGRIWRPDLALGIGKAIKDSKIVLIYLLIFPMLIL